MHAAHGVSVVCLDVDGTLLNSEQQLAPRVKSALEAAADAGVRTMLATGKAYGPWVQDILPQLPKSGLPTIYMQGGLVHAADGSILIDQALNASMVQRCADFARHHDVTLVAYSGNRIVTEATDQHTDRLIFYKEPTPQVVPEWVATACAAESSLRIHKVIFMAEENRILEIKQAAQEVVGSGASLTRALSGMLEVLPVGISKGKALAYVAQLHGFDMQSVLAMGDGENDISMLSSSGVAVAMGNASVSVKQVAAHVAPSNDADGVAVIVERLLAGDLQPNLAAAT